MEYFRTMILYNVLNTWLFSEEEFISSISKYNNLLTSGPDKLS